jgi:hypothetical protein
MRLMRVHDEPKLGLNVCPELTLDSPTSSSHQGGELTVVQHYLERRPLAALDLGLLATLGIIYEGCTACQTPPKAWAPAPLMRAGYAGVMVHKDASWLNMYKG